AKARQRHLMPQAEDDECIEGVLNILWSDIVKPVLDELGYIGDVPREPLPHITWCPTGLLSFLPLHAAGDYSQLGPEYSTTPYHPTYPHLALYSHLPLAP
ncbi:unnamed protein product, partial [Rhizoctonia solani]